MGRKCAITGCVSNKSGSTSTIHSFPKDNPYFRRRWEEFVRLTSDLDLDKVDLNNFGLCIRHFSSDEYAGSSSEEDDMRGKRQHLKKTALPVYLGKSNCRPLNNEDSMPTMGFWNDHSYAADVGKLEFEKLEKDGLIWIIEGLELRIREKDKIIADLRKKVHRLESKCTEETNDQQIAVSGENQNLHHSLSKMFSAGQIRLLENPCLRSINWTEEEKARAISLHSVSPRAYTYLREVLGYPLPCSRSIYLWIEQSEVLPDIPIQPVLRILEEMLKPSTLMMKQCAMAIDEMSIDPSYCYDSAEDRVLGGYKSVTVVTVRGIFMKWKQVLYFTFNSSISKDTLLGLIRDLYDIKAQVVSITTDMGPKNLALWKSLDVGQVQNGVIQKVSFPHPCNEEEIFILPDLPHLIKSLRNHVIDNGITDKNGTVLNRKVFEELINLQKAEHKLTHNLNYKHLNVRGKQRQEVRPAFQLFSHRVAEAIKFVYPDNPNKQKQAEIIELVNNFCDLSNTRLHEDSANVFQTPYGMHEDEQSALYDKSFELFSTMRVGKRKQGSFVPFQKGLLMYIISVKKLFQNLKQPPVNCKSIMTAGLNQDSLENVFSRLRGLGHFNMNPNAIQVMHRIKRLLLSWNFLDSKNTHTEFDTVDKNNPNQFRLNFLDAKKSSQTAVEFTSELQERLGNISTEVSIPSLSRLDFSTESCCEEGGIEYVAGFMAKKFIHDHPELSKQSMNEIRENFWVGQVSRGGLIEPSLYWHALFKKFDEFFTEVHPYNSVNKSKHICKNLEEQICSQFPNIKNDIVKYYVKTRTFIRIKYLNKQVQNEFYKRQGHKSQNAAQAECEEGELELSTEGQVLCTQLENI